MPLGVIAVIYEARPNVTVDCAALTLKSGNAIVLRGSSYAARSNAALAAWCARLWARRGCPRVRSSCSTAATGAELEELATAEGLVDLIIPRGGEGLKEALKSVATVPVMYAAAGNCHVYVHADADLEMARRVAYNAKVDRPGVCNAAETLLVDAAVADRFLPGVLARPARRRGRAGGRRAGPRGGGRAAVGEATDGGLGHRVPRDEDGGRGRRFARRRDRTREPARHRALGGDRDRRPAMRPRRSPTGSTRRSSTSTRRPASPMASSSGWGPRSGTRPRSFTRAARSACAS